MCGICGYISRNSITAEKLSEMTDTMTHRGPDDSGTWLLEDNGFHIGFGHRRLSIFDLSKLGHQPMQIDGGNITVTFNGEIYNFLELREELEQSGYEFRSTCDTEVLLYAYHKWGDECISKFNGMFAFCIYDKRNHRAVFARDRMGKKPLFYHFRNQTLIFGSEMKALMSHPEFVKDINKEMIASYLVNLCFHAPHTIFRNTYKLEPGCMMIWENGEIKKQKYWDLLPVHKDISANQITDAQDAKEGLKGRLTKSVEKRMLADVPVGLFLSGGIDSSLVAGIASGMTDEQVKTFTIGFFEQEQNEAQRAKKIAEHLGTNHTELYVSEEDVLSLTKDIPLYYDEPFADSSQIPTMLVSRLAKQDVTVALSGDGGDELFCGYSRYQDNMFIRKMADIAYTLKNIMLPPGISKLKIDRFCSSYTRTLTSSLSLNVLEELIFDVYDMTAKKMVKGEGVSAKETYSIKGIDAFNWQERYMLLDMLTYLPDDILCKVDRASMRYALELRCPLLDVDVVEYSFSVPMEYKYHNGDKKWLLKQLAYDYVPKELLDMPKRGFGVPMAKWLRGPLRDTVRKYSGKEMLEKQGIFDYETVAWMIKKVDCVDHMFNLMLWAFLMFQMWYQLYIEDLW